MYKKIAAGLLLMALCSIALAEPLKIQHKGLTLNANLEKASSNWQSGPFVLMLHGTLAHGAMEIMSGLQTMFMDRGISSLSITLSLGKDNRAGMYDCKETHKHKHTDAVDEIAVWIDWLSGQGVKQLALLGHSRGGNQVARYAVSHKDDKRVTNMFLVAPSVWEAGDTRNYHNKRFESDFDQLVSKAKTMADKGQGAGVIENIDFIYCEKTGATAASVLSYYVTDEKMDTPYLVSKTSMPVIVFAGSEDKVVEGLIEKVEPLTAKEHIKLEVMDGADHFFRDLYSEDIADIIAEAMGG